VEDGFLGLGFTIQKSGASASVIEFVSCPGFFAYVPYFPRLDDINMISVSGCRQWWEHAGYVRFTTTNTDATYFWIQSPPDRLCDAVLCDTTVVDAIPGGDAQWGGVPRINCVYTWDNVELTTWSKIKTLFR
jgi:hypothetical protein